MVKNGGEHRVTRFDQLAYHHPIGLVGHPDLPKEQRRGGREQGVGPFVEDLGGDLVVELG